MNTIKRLFLVVTIIFAIGVNSEELSIKYEHLSVESGLSQSSILSIHQGKNGYIWLGTAEGLNLFNGYDLKVFKTDRKDNFSISDNSINAIAEDSNENIWVATNKGINKYDKKLGVFNRYLIDAKENSIVDLKIINANIVALTATSLFIYSEATDNFTEIKFNILSDSENDISFTYMAYDNHGHLWLGTSRIGVVLYDYKNKSFIRHIKFPNNQLAKINTINYVNENTILIGSNIGLFQANSHSTELKKFSATKDYHTYLTKEVNDIEVIDEHVAWMATNYGLVRLDIKTHHLVHFSDSNSESKSNLLSLTVGQHGMLWLGTLYNGVNYFDSSRMQFGHIMSDAANELSHNMVFAFSEDKESIYIGTFGGGLNKISKSTEAYDKEFTAYIDDLIPSKMILSLLNDSNQSLWIGSYGNGLIKVNADGLVQRFNAGIDEGAISHDNILQIYETSKGDIWVGTWGGGLNKFNPADGTFERFTQDKSNPNSISDNTVWNIFEDSNGSLWLGTDKGLNVLDSDQSFLSFQHDDNNASSISSNRVFSIFEDSKKRLWVGTLGGLNLFNRDTLEFKHFTQLDGLPNDSIYGILEDSKGNLWLSTNKGISKYDPEANTFVNYDINDGLQSDEFNGGAYFKAQNGELFFGGINGFNRFLPTEIKDDEHKPSVVLTDFLIDNKSVSIVNLNNNNEQLDSSYKFKLPAVINQLESLTLTHLEKLITFEFAALHYSEPLNNQYAYKLDGWNEDWIYTDAKNRRATYTNLPAGEYTLRIKASNGDGYWNEEGKSLKITVLPAPWLTWWAFTFYAFVVFALAYAFVANEKRKRDIEHAINLRLKQVDKLKDEFLANTSHELRTPLNGIIGLAESLIDGIAGALPDKATKDLSMVVTSGKRLSNLVNDILDFSKLKNSSIALQLKPVDVSSMVDVVLALSRPLKGCKVIKLSNNIDKQLSPVSADEDRLQQILLNLVGNAIKFTDDGCISVSAFTKGNFITIEVNDTGIGIAPEKIESIFESFEQLEGEVTRTSSGTGLGLSITKKLIELHHGKIEVTSEVGVGSTFFVTLPISHALVADNNSVVQDNVAPLTQSENINISPELLSHENGIDENLGVDIIDKKTIAEKLSKFDENDYRILVVDDDPINRQVLVNHLSLKHYQVVEASSGEIALEIIKNTQAVIENTQREHSFSHRLSRPFDLILLDVMMPKISGYEVCQRLREHYSVNELPVIFLTAKDQVVDLVQSFSVGGNDYLNKPISKHELLTRVETHLKLLDINRNLETEVQQRTAELEKAMEAKSEFLAKMSHEIRTPMNAIIGLNHLTLKTALNKNQRDLLTKNQEASQSLLGLINDLLDYSKIEAGKMSIENIAMNVQSLIRKTANICSLKAHSKGIELIVDIHPDVPKTIQSDPVRLQQILVNLVGNAVKFTENGHVLLEVLPVYSEVNQLQFNVIDTGIGLDNRSLSNLFESFTQADSSITRKFGGTGLGLSICKQLTELMDGKIWVESELGKGSKFSFTISFKPSTAEKSATTIPVNVSGLSVLVVDDNHICVNILSEILSGFGCRVTTASSGKEALAQLSAAKLANRLFDVMLTDWHMPDMDGIELAKEVYNNRKHYPVRSALMVTAYDRGDAESLAKNVGINSFIEKPVDASVLLTAMVETLELDKFETQITTTGVIDLSSSNILLVEDNELNQQVVLGFLEETSANVTVVENGLLALEYVKNNAYDVVLMDIQMPEMDGITATTHLRRAYNFDELPIIAMTAHAMEEELNRCIQVGMNEYFTKPIDPNVLFTLLSKWVSRKREFTKSLPNAIGTQKADSNLGAAVVQTSQTFEALSDSIEPDTRFTICEQLKALNVIEVDQALEFMGNRVAIYEKLVVDFIRSYTSFDEEMKQLYTDGEFKELYRRVHSFKSNTASIGAKSIAEQASICETLIEKDAKSAQSAINQLALLTKDLMRQLSRIQTPEGEAKMIMLDKPKLNHLLTKVQIMLRSEDAEVEDLLPDISRLVQGSVLEKNVSEMIEFIEDIEYPSAISKLEVLLEHTMET